MEDEVVLTSTGHQKLAEELEFLVTVKRREVAERIKTSREFGDISENSEYDDAKNEQAFLEGRISEISRMLSNCKLIDSDRIATDKVCLGCSVELENLSAGGKERYRLVGSIEADPENCLISNESPVGKALLGHCPGDVVDVPVPQGLVKYRIIKISK
jgi:transcription elongation factor GreA